MEKGQQHWGQGGVSRPGAGLWPGRRVLAALLGLAWLILSGCQGPSALKEDFGRSVNNNLAQQVVNPQASRDLTPAVGLAPKTEQNVLEKYDKSFKPEEKKASEALKMTTGAY